MKKGYQLGILILLISSLTQLFGQQSIIIGNGSYTATNNPARYTYGYSWGANIYTKSEINGSGYINSIAYNIATPYSGTHNNQKIYMKEVTDSVFTNSNYISPTSINATLVYDGSVNFNSSGWYTFNLIQPFDYQGTGHLLILFENKSGVANGSYSLPLFNCTYKPNATKFKHTHTLSNYYQSGSSPFDYRANIKLGISADSNNLALLEWIYPNQSSTLSASTPIIVKVKNVGLATQSGFSLKYSIDNGQNWTTETFTGSLAPNAETAHSFLSTADMSANGVYNLIAVVDNVGDTIKSNDTIRQTLYNCGSGLSGTYYIGAGGTNPNYPVFSTIDDAVDALKTCGVSGNTIFLINSGTYNGNYILENINGLSYYSKLTFVGNGILEYNNPTNSEPNLIEINQLDYINFKNLTFKTNSTNNYSNKLIELNQCSNIIIKYCDFEGTTSTNNTNGHLIHINNSNNIILDSNNFKNGYSAIYFDNSSINPKNTDIDIYGNTIESAYEYGIRLAFIENSYVWFNKIKNRSTTANISYGIYLRGGDSTIIRNNLIIDTAGVNSQFRGIVIRDCSPSSNDRIKVHNNMISSHFINSSTYRFGIFAVNTSNADIYFNSINFNGNSPSYNRGINCDNSSNLNIKNNNIRTNNGYPIYLDGLYSTSSIDYNNLYSSNYVARVGYNSYTSITQYQNATLHANNSISVNPNFNSTEDLHVFNQNLDGAATPISYITYDYDMDVRDQNNPDIGADEFQYHSSDAGVAEITEPNDTIINSNSDVKIKIKNYGTDPLTSVTIGWSVNGTYQTQYSWNGNLATQVTSGIITIGSHNFTTGSNQIKIWTHNPNNLSDINNTNDTMTKTVFYNPVPILNLSTNSITDTIIYCGNTTSNNIQISNTGNGDLNFLLSSSSSWLSAISLNGYNITSGNNAQLNISFNSANLSSGTHIGTITINSNDPNNPNVNVNCTLVVKNLLQNQISLGNDIISCGNMVLNGPSGFTDYSWSSGQNTQNINVSNSGVYILNVIDANSCTSADTISVTINPVPNVSFNSIPASMCDNESIINLQGSPVGGNFIGPGVNLNKFNPANANFGLNHLVYTYTNPYGCSNSDTQSVEVWNAPIVDAGADTTIYTGDQANLSSVVTGGSGIYSYSWDPDSLVSNSTSASTSTSNLVNSTDYTLNVTDLSYGCQSYDEVTVIVSGGPLSLNVSSSASVICAGDSIKLSAIPTGGTGNYSYSWTSNPPGFTSNVQNPVVQPNINRTYICSVNDGSNSANSNTTVSVNPAPSISMNLTDTIFCSNENPVQISVSPSGGVFTGGGITGNTFNPSSAPIGSSNINYTYTTSQGCSTEANQMVFIKKAPTAFAGNDTTLNCANNGIQLGQQSEPHVLYIWSPAYNLNKVFSSNPIAYPKMSVNYKLKALDTLNMCSSNDTVNIIINGGPNLQISNDTIICYGDSIDLYSSGGDSYLWSNGLTDSIINVSPLKNTAYSLIISKNGCDATDTVFVTVSNPDPGLVSDTTICAGDSILLNAGIWNSYQWSTGANSQAIFLDSTGVGFGTIDIWVIVQNNLGCMGSDTISVTFNNCIGIEENENNNPIIKVFPNPSSSELNIAFNKTQSDNVDILIYNALGQLINSKSYSISKNSDIIKLDIKDLANGVYYLNFRNGDYSEVVKIIKSE